MVVFDWNGTLFDDAHATWQAANAVLNFFKRPSIDFDTYKTTISIPTYSFYLEHGCSSELLNEHATESASIFNSHYEDNANATILREGAREILGWLRSHRIPCVLLSNHKEQSITHHMQRLDILNFFETIIGNNKQLGVRYRNSKEVAFEQFMRDNPSISSHSLLFVGDSPDEAKLARCFSATSILIRGGAYSDKRLVQANPNWILDNLQDFQPIIEGILTPFQSNPYALKRD